MLLVAHCGWRLIRALDAQRDFDQSTPVLPARDQQETARVPVRAGNRATQQNHPVRFSVPLDTSHTIGHTSASARSSCRLGTRPHLRRAHRTTRERSRSLPEASSRKQGGLRKTLAAAGRYGTAVAAAAGPNARDDPTIARRPHLPTYWSGLRGSPPPPASGRRERGRRTARIRRRTEVAFRGSPLRRSADEASAAGLPAAPAGAWTQTRRAQHPLQPTRPGSRGAHRPAAAYGSKRGRVHHHRQRTEANAAGFTTRVSQRGQAAAGLTVHLPAYGSKRGRAPRTGHKRTLAHAHRGPASGTRSTSSQRACGPERWIGNRESQHSRKQRQDAHRDRRSADLATLPCLHCSSAGTPSLFHVKRGVWWAQWTERPTRAATGATYPVRWNLGQRRPAAGQDAGTAQ
jgi:hypothetical protein